MTAIVSIKGVGKSYVRGKQRVEVLKDLDLEVERGEFLALMGPSGSGKTTLLNLIGGLDRPDSGEIDGGRRERSTGMSGGPAREVARAARRLHLPVLQPAARAHGRAQRRGAAAAHEALGAKSASATSRPRSRSWGSPTARSTSRPSSPAASSNASRSRARSSRSHAARLRRADGRPRPRDVRVDSRAAAAPEPKARQDDRDGHARSARGRARVAATVRRQGRARPRRCSAPRHEIPAAVWSGLWRKRARTILTLISVVVAFSLFGIVDGVTAAFDHAIDRLTDAAGLRTRAASTSRRGCRSRIARGSRACPACARSASSTSSAAIIRTRETTSTRPRSTRITCMRWPTSTLADEQLEAMQRTRDGRGHRTEARGKVRLEDRRPRDAEVAALDRARTARSTGRSTSSASTRFPKARFPPTRTSGSTTTISTRRARSGNGTVTLYLLKVDDAAASAEISERNRPAVRELDGRDTHSNGSRADPRANRARRQHRLHRERDRRRPCCSRCCSSRATR